MVQHSSGDVGIDMHAAHAYLCKQCVQTSVNATQLTYSNTLEICVPSFTVTIADINRRMAAPYQPVSDLQHAAHTGFQCSLHVQPLLRMYGLVIRPVQFLEHLHVSDIGTGPLPKGLQATL